MYERLDDVKCNASRRTVGCQHIVDTGERCPVVLLQGGIVHFGNLQPTDATSQKRIDGNFIGGTQPSGGRTTNASGGVGKAQTTKRFYVGWLEIQAA